MSPRRKPRPRTPSAAPRLPPVVPGRVEVGADGEEYQVRTVPGSRALKTYRCPGCDHEIAPRTPHVVVWPTAGGAPDDPNDSAGAADRRHWHSGCWAHRSTRGPTRRWS